MRKKLRFTSLSLLLSLPIAHSQAQQIYDSLAAKPDGLIHFNSVTPANRYQLAHRTYPPTPKVIWGTLSLPSSKAPYPAMVIAHGSAGVQKKDGQRWVPLLNSMGIATFQVDSFKPRNIDRTDEDQSQLDQSANDADALAALKLLATDPRIDPKRIGVMGFSRGGIVALETAVNRFREGVIDGDLRFAAHIAFYPGCGLRYWRTPSPMTGAPIMMALGEKDDYVPAKPCLDYAETMQQAGQEVEVHVYKNAYHDFDNTVQYLKHSDRTETGKHCAEREIDPVSWQYKFVGSGETFRDYKAFAAKLGNCVTRGDVTTGSNPAAAKESEGDVRTFLQRVFKLER